MLTRKLIKDRHVGFLYSPGSFEKILESGNHFLSWSKTVDVCNLADFPAAIPNAEWLIATHAIAMADHLDIVQTGVNEVALVSRGEQRHFVRPNSRQVFWKKDLPIQIRRANLENNLKVPTEWLTALPIGEAVACIRQVTMPATGYGLLFVDNRFCDYLGPGRHAYFDVLPKTRLTICSQSQVIESKKIVKSILASDHPVVTKQLTTIETSRHELALWWDDNQLVHVCGAAVQALASRQLHVELIPLAHTPTPVSAQVATIMRSSTSAQTLLAPHVARYSVPSDHIGMFHVDGVLEAILQPGDYLYWHGGKQLSLTIIDTRLTVIDLRAQEMLTQDKVRLRANVTTAE